MNGAIGSIDSVQERAILNAMGSISTRFPGLAEASAEEKIALIDELWDAVRRSGVLPIPTEHLTELERRVAAVAEDPAMALTPAQARALLRK